MVGGIRAGYLHPQRERYADFALRVDPYAGSGTTPTPVSITESLGGTRHDTPENSMIDAASRAVVSR